MAWRCTRLQQNTHAGARIGVSLPFFLSPSLPLLSLPPHHNKAAFIGQRPNLRLYRTRTHFSLPPFLPTYSSLPSLGRHRFGADLQVRHLRGRSLFPLGAGWHRPPRHPHRQSQGRSGYLRRAWCTSLPPRHPLPFLPPSHHSSKRSGSRVGRHGGWWGGRERGKGRGSAVGG